MSVRVDSEGRTAKRDDYEPPRVVSLGTVSELTAAAGTGSTDAVVFSTAISDRRLKCDLVSVQPTEVVAKLAALS